MFGAGGRVPGLRIELDDRGILPYSRVHACRKLRGRTELTELTDTTEIFGNAVVRFLVTEGRAPVTRRDVSRVEGVEYSGMVMQDVLRPLSWRVALCLCVSLYNGTLTPGGRLHC